MTQVKTEGTGEGRFLTLPNLLSLARIPLAAVFVVVDDPWKMSTILVAAALTDFFDGKIARARDTVSRAGQYLDPICDKLFVWVALGSFVSRGEIGLVAFAILTLRDFCTVGGFLTGRMCGFRVRPDPRWPGKLATGMQLLALMVLIATPEQIGLMIPITGGVNAWAVIDYGIRAWRSRNRSVPGAGET